MFTNQELLKILYLQAHIFCNNKQAKQGLDMWDTIDELELTIKNANQLPKPPQWISI